MIDGKPTAKTVEYGNKPKKLTIVCPHCEFKYDYIFQNTKYDTNLEWFAELSKMVCPRCSLTRI